MCLAPPARVLEVRPGEIVVQRGEAELTVATFMIEERLAPGDWVAVQAQRYAIQRLTDEEAAEMNAIYELIHAEITGAVHP